MEKMSADDFALLQKTRVYFNHMSVGENILTGLNKVIERHGPLQLIRVDQTHPELGNAFFAHSYLGKNGEPKSKIDAFARFLGEKMAGQADIALMKLCYVDIDRSTDITDLFGYYKGTITDLERTYPKLTIVHVTSPLTVQYQEPAWKTFIRETTGLKDGVARANIRRAAFNDLMRQNFSKEKIFDLALIESTRPDGTRESFVRHGVAYPSLYPGYTQDGGHLHGPIQEIAAQQLVHTLASGWRDHGAPPRQSP